MDNQVNQKEPTPIAAGDARPAPEPQCPGCFKHHPPRATCGRNEPAGPEPPDLRSLAQEVIGKLWERRDDCADPDCECPLQDAWKDWHCIARLRAVLATPAPAPAREAGEDK